LSRDFGVFESKRGTVTTEPQNYANRAQHCSTHCVHCPYELVSYRVVWSSNTASRCGAAGECALQMPAQIDGHTVLICVCSALS